MNGGVFPKTDILKDTVYFGLSHPLMKPIGLEPPLWMLRTGTIAHTAPTTKMDGLRCASATGSDLLGHYSS